MVDGNFEGVVDDLTGNILRGWARDAGQIESPLTIEVHHNGQLLASAEASLFRADLASAGKGDGHCAFALILKPPSPPGTVLIVSAVSGSERKELVGSPFTIPDLPSRLESTQAVAVFPLPMASGNLHGSLDQCGPNHLRGWLRRLDGKPGSQTLSLQEDSRELVRFEANQWRADLAELHLGDGSCGFDLPMPTTLFDGDFHVLDVRLTEDGSSLLDAPFRIRTRPVSSALVGATSPAPLQRPPATNQLTLSVIVNFYNMQREAGRTLTSLSRDYQRQAGDLDYEVLCIDNGSTLPLDPEWIASFGPEFRLVRPARQFASPCSAINEAALQARGKYLAVMIDGAHLLTPGVFDQALQAWRENPDAVVALRHWFVGGDQRWLAMAGYSREQEDHLFERIRWPLNGYDLFRVSAPIGENPEPWFDGLSESNCLMLPTALYDSIGGFDEAFDQPGGGFANLDLWCRASQAASGPLVSLIGEASFHQFHDGTTTNVDDAEKDLRVRAYANAYRTLRGEEYAGVHRSRLSFRGCMPSEFATGVRQRSLLPMRLGVTDQVRKGQLALHFDDGAQSHLQSVYAECGLQREVCWLGLPTGVAPADLINLQEIIHQLRPDAIIAVGVENGLVGFLSNIFAALGGDAGRILHVCPETNSSSPLARVTTLPGHPDDPAALVSAGHWTGSAETVLVLYTVGPIGRFSAESLKAWSSLVSYRSWLICIGTLFGQPWLGYSRHEHLRTVHDFIRANPSFVVDHSWNRQLISTCPSGYLRKVGGTHTAANYDASLDTIAPASPMSPENPQ